MYNCNQDKFDKILYYFIFTISSFHFVLDGLSVRCVDCVFSLGGECTTAIKIKLILACFILVLSVVLSGKALSTMSVPKGRQQDPSGHG